jgi:SEC-C motif
MRLSADQVNEGILHPDQDVREAVVYYFARSFCPDPAIMPLVIGAIERHGFDHAFETYTFMDDLAQTEATVRWLIAQIERAVHPANEQEAQPILVYSSALVHADACVLQGHEHEIMGLEALDPETRDAVGERIWFQSRPPAELWGDLEEFCQTHEDEESVPTEEFDFACRLVEALGRHPVEFAAKVLSILCGDTGDFDNWMEGFSIRLAGEMRLEAAIPWLLEMLTDDGDWVHEECHRALAKIGTEAVVAQFAKDCPKGDWNLRMSAACILEDIHSDLSVQTCLALLNTEVDQQIRGILLQAILLNFATEGVELARSFVLGTPLDPHVLEVRSALLTACKLMGRRFPEFDAWVTDSQTDQEFRRKWYEEHPLTGDDEEDGNRDSEEGLEDEEREEEPALPPTTFVRHDTRIGRNDPCPCGSGKKFKKCCMSKGQIEDESDSGHAVAMSGVRHRQPPKYPIGTVALYGPDDKTTTKIAAGVILHENAEPIVERWVGTKVKDSVKVQQQMQQFFAKHGVKTVVATDRNMGCPHEGGEDFPSGEDCPFCPFWKGKQGTARRS